MNLIPDRRLRRPLLKGAAFFLSLLALVAAAHFFNIEALTDPDWVERHLRHDPSGVLLFLALTAGLSAVGLPRQALAGLGGFAFGALWGSVLVSLALPMGSALGFFYARLLGRSTLQRRFGPRITRLERFLSQNPFATTVAVRFFPLGNNAVTNMLAGITHIRPLPFLLGSAVGYLPQNVVFCLLGSGLRVDPLWRSIVACLLFIAATLLGIAVFRKYSRSLAPQDESPA